MVDRLLEAGVESVGAGMFADNAESRRIIEKLDFESFLEGPDAHLRFRTTADAWADRPSAVAARFRS